MSADYGDIVRADLEYVIQWLEQTEAPPNIIGLVRRPLAALARLEAAEAEERANPRDVHLYARLDEIVAQRDALAEAMRRVDAEAEVARTDATGDIYEISEDTLARVKDALAEAGLE